MFDICIFFLFSCRLVDGTDEVQSVSVMEGESVTLHSGVTEVQKYLMMEWMFGEARVAEISRFSSSSSIYDDKTHKNRLKLDPQTGSLTITDTRTTDSGLYQLILTSGVTTIKKFSVTVSARLPVPVISSNSSQCSSSSSSDQNCSLVCSAVNVGHVTLSWFRGISVLSSISVSDLSIISLSLEIECLDDSYSCVLNNPIRNQTTHLNITQLCQPCAGNSVSLIVLVSAAAGSLLIVAALVVFCICRKHRKSEQEVQTRDREITYADPTFNRRQTEKK